VPDLESLRLSYVLGTKGGLGVGMSRQGGRSQTEELLVITERVNSLVSNSSAHATTALAITSQVMTTVDQVATTVGEVSLAAQAITSSVERSNALAEDASTGVREATTSMDRLSEASKAIEKSIRLIERISEQINVLALNATIEAARAGQFGKGFSIVAREVKALAIETRKATQEVDDRVTAVFLQIDCGVKSVRALEGVVSEMNGLSHTIRDAAARQARQLSEVATHTTRASEALKLVTAEVEQVAEVSMDAGSVVEELARTLAPAHPFPDVPLAATA